jgi:hypothetical protein
VYDSDIKNPHYRHKEQSLRNWRHFSYDFKFAPQRVAGAWQSIFEITIPQDVIIIPRPDIESFQGKG